MRRTPVLILAGALAASAFAGAALGAPLGDRTLYRIPNDGPYWLTAGTDGTIWYTNDGAADVVGMDSNGSILRRVDAGARTFGIATAADGRHWFANRQGNDQGVGRVDADGGNYTFFPSGGTALQAVTIGPDGNPWFTEWDGGGRIGTVRADGTVVRFPVGSNAGYGLTAGPDGNVWYAELNRNGVGEYVRVTPSGQATRWPADPGLADIAADGSGNLWVVSESTSTSHNILKINTSGQELDRYNVPNAGIRQIALGPDGAMWFTACNDGKIGRIDASGAVQTWVADPDNPTACPFDIVWGPGGDMWYTVLGSGSIGRIGTGATTPPPGAGGVTGPDAGGASPAPTTPSAPAGCGAPPAGPVGFSINRGEDYTNSVDVTLDVIWPICTTTVQLANDGGFRSAQSRAVAASIPWRLSTSGPERLPKTVYLRFGSSSQNFTDDIILDQAPPQVTSATATAATQSANARRPRSAAPRVVVTARARDRGASGPGVIEVRAGRKVVQARYGSRAIIRTGLASVNVRVRDRAGNWSRMRAVTVR